MLVVGDWLVDEHWVVGKHRSATSSRTGGHHSRALHTDTCSVRSLCGAGQVATILHQTLKQDRQRFNVVGIGIWHPEDTASLAPMLDPEFNEGKTPHRLSAGSGQPEDVAHVELYNLAGRADQPIVNVGTTRCIRIYENTPAGLTQRQRIDWELPLSTDGFATMWERLPETLERVFQKGEEIHHILVKDLRKGAVDEALVSALQTRFPNALWYISSKEWRPDWLEKLKKKPEIELLIVPPVAAQRAVIRGKLSAWVTIGDEPSRDAFDVTHKLAGDYGIKRLVVHPSAETILSYERSTAQGFALPTTTTPTDTVPFTPMASVFFPALVAHLIDGEKDTPFAPILQRAVAFTDSWQVYESRRLTVDDWRPSDKQVLVLDDAPAAGPLPAHWRPYDWNEATQLWDDALTELGVVEVPDASKREGVRHEFQLWRGMTEIGDYIACSPEKRLALSRIYREGRGLAKTPIDERRHKSFLIVDSPGSGKSYMVQCLRTALRMETRHYNITRLQSRHELFDCFQDIASVQSGTTKPLLIFVDELNSKVDGHHIYNAFLEPLEDGRFVRSGSTSTIAPCLWIFAGTAEPSESGGSNQGMDFEQRLSAPVFHFKESGRHETPLTKTERVYVGVACLVQRFPEVKRVSGEVLRAFWLMEKAVPREVRRFVWDFEDVQYSRVLAHNLPREHQRKFGHGVAAALNKTKDDEALMVEIKRRPGE